MKEALPRSFQWAMGRPSASHCRSGGGGSGGARILSTSGLIGARVSTSAWMLIVAGVVGGLPQGWGNPATNALIAAVVEPGSRGVMTGIKQSGVTLAVFLAGGLAPSGLVLLLDVALPFLGIGRAAGEVPYASS